MTNEEKLICDLTWISTSSHLSHSSVNQDSSISIPVNIWCNDGYDNRDDHSPLNSIGFLMNPRVTFLSSLWILCCVLSEGCMHTLIVVSIYCRVTGDNWGCCSFHNGLLSVLISYQGGFIHYHIYPPWPVADNDSGTEDTELFHKLKLLPPPWSGFQYPPCWPKQCSALGTVEQGFYYQEIYYPRCRHGPLRSFQLSQLRTPRGIV